MTINLLIISIILIYGLLIGSFLNVCIYRIPLGVSLSKSRSHCMGCGKPLRNRDLIPVVSYLLLKGRCRNCSTKISIQYPLIELLNGVIYIAIFLIRGLPGVAEQSLNYHLTTIVFCFTASALIVLSVIDFRIYEIPEKINLFLLVAGLIRMGLDYHNWGLYLIGFFCVSGFLYLIYVLSKGKAIGGGDIKLMAVAGLIVGWKNILLALFLGCLLGSILHILRMKIKHADRMLAMGPYLSAGIFIAMLFGDQLVSWYLRLLL